MNRTTLEAWLWLFLVVAWFAVSLLDARAHAQMPRATAWDQQHAQLAISEDGSTVTVRAQAPASLRVCFELSVPALPACVRVGDVRSGKVTLR